MQTIITKEQLKAFIDRIERLEEDKAGIATDIKEVYAEAKANGYDDKIMRQIVKLRKKDAAEREEEQTILDLYQQALGMLPEMEDCYGQPDEGGR